MTGQLRLVGRRSYGREMDRVVRHSRRVGYHCIKRSYRNNHSINSCYHQQHAILVYRLKYTLKAESMFPVSNTRSKLNSLGNKASWLSRPRTPSVLLLYTKNA